jgi:hypothetical protein
MDPFLETILMSSAFRAATGQGKETHIYRSKKHEETQKAYHEAKKQFREAFRDRIKRECQAYQAAQVDEARWLGLIALVKNQLTAAHANILNAGQLRVGTVQKMLSLALKFYWKSGENEKKPFWPPLDAQVIKAARKSLEKQDKGISWKKLDDSDQYARIMRAINKFAESRGFADANEWEYTIWETNDEL